MNQVSFCKAGFVSSEIFSLRGISFTKVWTRGSYALLGFNLRCLNILKVIHLSPVKWK